MVAPVAVSTAVLIASLLGIVAASVESTSCTNVVTAATDNTGSATVGASVSAVAPVCVAAALYIAWKEVATVDVSPAAVEIVLAATESPVVMVMATGVPPVRRRAEANRLPICALHWLTSTLKDREHAARAVDSSTAWPTGNVIGTVVEKAIVVEDVAPAGVASATTVSWNAAALRPSKEVTLMLAVWTVTLFCSTKVLGVIVGPCVGARVAPAGKSVGVIVGEAVVGVTVGVTVGVSVDDMVGVGSTGDIIVA